MTFTHAIKNTEAYEKIIDSSRDLLALRGMLFYDNSTNHYSVVPCTIFPSPFPQKIFRKAVRIQKYINTIFHNAACDDNFLRKTLLKSTENDEFLGKLWHLYESVKQEGPAQRVLLGLNRADYMAHHGHRQQQQEGIQERRCEPEIRMVENNLMASSLSTFSEALAGYHHFNLCQLHVPESVADQMHPVSKPASGLANGIYLAWKLYKRQLVKQQNMQSEGEKPGDDATSLSHLKNSEENTEHQEEQQNEDELAEKEEEIIAVLFVLAEAEMNTIDISGVQRELYRKSTRIRVIRTTFERLSTLDQPSDFNVDPHTKILTVNAHHIGVVYFRHGYAPEHFGSGERGEALWRVKLDLERSRAIKCPSIQYLLANTKLVQAAIAADPRLIDRFLISSQPLTAASSSTTASTFFSSSCSSGIVTSKNTFSLEEEDRDTLIEALCSAQHSLNDISRGTSSEQQHDDNGGGEAVDAIAQALRHPDQFVLKPQREGGGNNYFDDDLVVKLKEIQFTKKRSGYVLMERFNPEITENLVLTRSGEFCRTKITSELGIFGVILADATETFANYECGYLLRSKKSNSNETGIAAGFGFVDTPIFSEEYDDLVSPNSI